MFDKLREAVSDVSGGGDNVEKASDPATAAIDEAKAGADGAISQAAHGHLSAGILQPDAAMISVAD